MRAGRLGAGLAGVLAYAACVLALAPATLVDAGLQRASDGRVRLAEARGTLWSGSGQIEIRDAGGSAGLGNSLSWQFEPRALLRGALRFELDLGAALKRFPVTISRSGIDIGEAQFVVPAAVLGLAVRRLALLKPTGDLVVRTSALSLRAGALSGNALVQWHAAGSPLSPVSPLGDYELRVALDAGAFDAEL